MEILVFSVCFTIVVGILLPIIYFFKSKPSVAVGWAFLGWMAGGIGSFIGFVDLTNSAVNQIDKAIKEKKEEMKTYNSSNTHSSKPRS